MIKIIKNYIKKYILAFLFFGINLEVTGGESWKKIETEHYELIYKSSFDKRANKIANTLEYVYAIVNKSLGANPKKVPVYLDNEALESNGATSFTKVHICTYTPSNYTFIGGSDWLTFLISHELRHVAQHNLEFRGFTKLIYYLLGGPVFLSNYNTILLHIPSWFYEGDAVVAETILSKYGRLSFPSYLMNTKSVILEGPNLNYHQAFYGSDYRQLPGHYQFGTIMVTHMRRKYGKNVVRDILLYTSIHKPLFYAAVKAVTGKKITEIYEDAKEELRELWKKQLEGLIITTSERLSKRKSNIFLNYFHPQSLENGNILVLKFDQNNNYEFSEINPETKEEKYFYTPYKLLHKNSKFSISGDTIIWLEPRYESTGKKTKYNSIKGISIMKMILDKNGKKNVTSVSKGRFVNASISNNKEMIVALETHKNYDHELKILNSKTGKCIKRFPNPENRFYIYIDWMKDDENLIATISHKDKISLETINIHTGEHTVLLKPGYENIGSPYHHKDYIYYSSAYSGIDNIYALNLITKKKFQVTSKKYGAFSPSVSKCEKYLLFSNYDKDGLELERMDIDPYKWIPIKKVENRDINYYEPLLEQEDEKIEQEKIPNKIYKSTNYFIFKSFFRPSSWMSTLVDNIAFFFTAKGEMNNGFFLGFLLNYDDIFGIVKQEYDFKIYLDKSYWIIRSSWTFLRIFPITSIATQVDNLSDDIQNIMRKNRSLDIRFDFPFSFPIEGFCINATPTFSFSCNRSITTFLDTKDSVLKKDDTNDNTTLNYTGQIIIEISKSKIGRHVVKPNKYTIGGVYSMKDSFKEKNFKNNYDSTLRRFRHSNWGLSSKWYIAGFSDSDVFILKNVFQKVNTDTYFENRYRESISKNSNTYYKFVDNLKYSLPNSHIGNIYGSRISYCFPIYYPDFAFGYFLFVKNITMTLYMEHIFLEESKYYRNKKKIDHIFTFGSDLYLICWPLSFDNHRDRDYDLKIKLFYKYSPQGFDLQAFHSGLRYNLSQKKVNVSYNSVGISLSLEKHNKEKEIYF